MQASVKFDENHVKLAHEMFSSKRYKDDRWVCHYRAALQSIAFI